MGSALGIASGVEILNSYSTTDLNNNEVIAATAIQSAILKRARALAEQVYHLDTGSPDCYKDPHWWWAIDNARNDVIGAIDGSNDFDNLPSHRTLSSASNISSELLSIMKEYIPNNSEEQLEELFEIFTGRSLSGEAIDCMNSWNNNWLASQTYSAFGFSNSWKMDDDDDIELFRNIMIDISFFSISSVPVEWVRVFSEWHVGALDIYTGRYRVTFNMAGYLANKKIIEQYLGGSPEDVIHHAPIG